MLLKKLPSSENTVKYIPMYSSCFPGPLGGKSYFIQVFKVWSYVVFLLRIFTLMWVKNCSQIFVTLHWMTVGEDPRRVPTIHHHPNAFTFMLSKGKTFSTRDLKDSQQTRLIVLLAPSFLRNKWCSWIARANIAWAQERLSGDTEIPVWSSRLGQHCMVRKTHLLKDRSCLKVGRDTYVKYI